MAYRRKWIGIGVGFFKCVTCMTCLGAGLGGARAFADDARKERDCRAAVSHPERVRDEARLVRCMDFYFTHEGLDVPAGSFNRVIALGTRAIAINPRNGATYLDVAWLWYSKWSSWHQAPAQMPDGAAGARRAAELIQAAVRVPQLAADGGFHWRAGDALLPIVQNYRRLLQADVPELRALMRESYEAADRLLAVERDRIRIRLNLASAYYFEWKQMRARADSSALSGEERATLQDDLGQAIALYQNVLALDPAQPVASKYLAILRRADVGPSGVAQDYTGL